MTVKGVLTDAEQWEGKAVRLLKALMENVLFTDGDYWPKAQELINDAPTSDAMSMVSSWARPDQLTMAACDLELAMRRAVQQKSYCLAAKATMEIAEREAKAYAEEHKLLDGKNPEVRNAQLAKVLVEREDYIQAAEALEAAEINSRQADLELDIARIHYQVAKSLVEHEAAMAQADLDNMAF